MPSSKSPKPPQVVPQNQQSSYTSQSSAEPQTCSGLNQDAEDQFELELCWCVQQLEAALMDLKLQDKQIFNMTKSLNVLKSHNASLIRKRQVMRNTFGDYRVKMSEDEKKFGKSTTHVKFAPADKKFKPKAICIKKIGGAVIKPVDSIEDNEPQKQAKTTAIMNPAASNEPFKFNFSVDTS